MHVCFCYVYLRFSVLSQEIGWEEHLCNDLFCAKWDVKPQLNQPWSVIMSHFIFDYNSCISYWNFYIFCSNGDRKE